MAWKSSEEKLRRKFRRLARASGMMTQEIARLRDQEERLKAAIRALAIYAAVVTLTGIAVVGIGR